MRLIHYISELTFSKKTDIKITTNDNNRFVTEFEFLDKDNEKVGYAFEADLMEYDLDQWAIEFFDTYGESAATGAVSVVEIFSAVAQSLELFVKMKQPNSFGFSPLNPKLDALYKRFGPKLAKKLKGYEYDFDGANHTFTKPNATPTTLPNYDLAK
jgi:hypothetical protein